MVVQHNLTAMYSNRMLGVTTKKQAKGTERLSSGYKINRAADDASGLSISEKMRKQIRGLTQASSNAQDGISAVQTAEGALAEVHDMLQRMNELAVKASNGTNSETDRSYIQSELDQLITEIDRVSTTTKFNETYLLKGRNAETGNAAELTYNTAKANLRDILAANAEGDDEALNAVMEEYFDDKTGKVILGINVYEDGDAMEIAADEEHGETAGSYNTREVVLGDKGFALVTSIKQPLDADGKEKSYSFDDIKLQDEADDYKLFNSEEEWMAAIKSALNGEGDVKNGRIDRGYGVDAESNPLGTGTKESLVLETFADLNDAMDVSLHVGADSTEDNKISLDLSMMSARGLGINGLKVDGDTADNATAAIDTITAAIQRVSSQRSELGAVQNRLEHTVSNLDNIVENTTSAESQIRDTDMATEMVKFSNNNILSQAGQAMLSQANQSNQGVLSLLG